MNIHIRITRSFCMTVCWKKGSPASCLRTSSTVTSPLPCWPNSGQCLQELQEIIPYYRVTILDGYNLLLTRIRNVPG